MSTELSNGVIIPEEYSDDWYDEMSINLRKLNDVITAASDNATDIQRLDTDKANQSDLTALTSRVNQNETDIIALQTAVSGALKREIVQTLPTEDISTTTIYMIRNSESSGTNIYDEYMYINSQWELIGTSATDFSNYYTKNETDNLLSGKVDNSTLGSYYTKTESDNLLSAKANQTDLTSLSGRVTQNETDITALQTAVSGALKREIVQSLPTQDISTTTIYMIRNTTTSGDNIYDEYMYINNLWELIGTSATDFSNYYTKTEIDTLLSGKANDSDVVHRSGDETVGGVKTFADTPVFTSFDGIRFRCAHNSNAYITFGDSNQANPGSLILSAHDGNVGTTIHLVGKTLIPYNNNDTALGSSSRSWKDFYSYHGYFRGQQQNDEYSVNARTNLTLLANRDTLGQSGCVVDTFRENTSQGTGSHILGFGIKENSVRYQGCRLSWLYDNDNNGYVFALRPTTQGSNQPIKYELGTSSAKWSTFNGLEPSSLSLPSGNLTDSIDISSYFANTSDTNSYTASANGWIYLRLGDISSCQATVYDANNNRMWGQTATGRVEQITIPILKGQTLTTEWATTSSVNVDTARFIPCQGNV